MKKQIQRKVNSLIAAALKLQERASFAEQNIQLARKEKYIVVSGELISTKNHKDMGQKQVVSKKTGKLKTIHFPMKTKAARGQDRELSLQLWRQKEMWAEILKAAGGPSYPLRINFKIYRGKKGRFDYVNIVQGLLDVMTMQDYFPDDSADYVIPSFSPYEIDRSNPRCIITVLD